MNWIVFTSLSVGVDYLNTAANYCSVVNVAVVATADDVVADDVAAPA